MTRTAGGPRPAAAPALAIALLAAVLGAGTGLSGLRPAGPAFPSRPADPPARPVPAPPAAHALDLNRADAAALARLPGVGPVLADRILAHRAAEGPFGRAEDLRRVPGIGPARWARLQPLVRVAP
ncbi:MAG: ComEA family DNA-binding protein [Candidatus Methylomirabilales bacterium]